MIRWHRNNINHFYEMLKTVTMFFLIVLSFSCNNNDVDCDSDGDGCIDIFDDFPKNSNYFRDSDHDGIADEVDLDRDGNGYIDNFDAVRMDFPDSSDTFIQSLINDPFMATITERLRASCLEDTDGDGCNDLFDHYPDDPDKDTNPEIYGTGEIPTCKDRMNDCEGKYIVNPP